MDSTFVLIHGGSSNAASWAPLQQQLALRGQRSIAVDLPGHGADAPYLTAYHRSPQDLEELARLPSPLAHLTVMDSVAHVVDVVRELSRFGPVALVSSSMGGLAATGAANLVPDLIAHNVYLSSAVPMAEEPVWDADDTAGVLLDDAVAPLVVVNPVELGAVRLNWRLALGDRTLFLRAKEAMMAEATDEQFAALLRSFDTDELFVTPAQAGEHLDADEADERSSSASATVALDPRQWGSVPHTYVRLTGDRCISLRQQDTMITWADRLTPENPFDVRTIDASHIGYFARPIDFADVLLEATTAMSPRTAR